MKDASPALLTLLNEDTFKMASLYTFVLKDGTTFRWTSADIDLVYGGQTFVSGVSLIGGGRMRSIRGLESDECVISMAPLGSLTVNGVDILRAARQGMFDRASFLQQRVFMESWGDTSPGVVHIFSGFVSGVRPTGTKIEFMMKSDLHILDVEMPRKVYQPACTHTFGDSGCGFDRASTAVNSTATSGSTSGKINCGLAQDDGYWELGTVRMTSGPNAGLMRSVNRYVTGRLDLLAPFPEPVSVGNTFTVTRGCPRTFDACTEYDNTARFRGFPYIPVPETAV